MEEHTCHTWLGLGLGCGSEELCMQRREDGERNPPVKLQLLFPLETKSNNEDEEIAKKKFRLTREQTSLLKERFREHNFLTLNQKQELAEKLNLLPRQVKIWFRNRRARTKLKQKEVHYELLKKCFESLSEENLQLKRKVQELPSIKPNGWPYHEYFSKAAQRVCPSCKRNSVSGDGRNNNNDGLDLKPNLCTAFMESPSHMAC